MSSESAETTGSAEVQRILALDLGIGSYGIALQEQRGTGSDRTFCFPIVRSCTVPEMWASMENERKRRRMFRTRLAHKAREKWLREVFETNGLKNAVLHGRRITETRVELPDGRLRYQLAEKGNYKLEREFPPHLGEKTDDGARSDEAGSRTVYCGAALRCLLLLGEPAQNAVQGRTLEDWQVFKALHSAIQKRGYDPKVPWARVHEVPQSNKQDKPRSASKARGKKSEAVTTESEDGEETAAVLSEEEQKQREEEAVSLERAKAMRGAVAAVAKDDPRYMHPCFWEAHRMGLWSVENPEQIKLRCGHDARSAKWDDQNDPGKKPKPGEKVIADANKMPAVFPRDMVEAEFMALCHAAEALLPQLAGKARFIAYGPPEIAYPNIPRLDPKLDAVEKQRREAMQHLARYKGEGDYVRGKEAEWNAALGQKAPTFDNRCVGTCALLPRYNVAKCDLVRNKDGQWDADSLLAAEVSFLLQVKNFRFVPELKDGRDWLNAEDMRKLYADHFHQTVIPGIESPGQKGAITRAKMSDWLEEHFDKPHTPKPGQDNKVKDIIIEKPRRTGRSRFSRPALRILRALLFSGLSPLEFRAKLLDLSNANELIADGAGTWGHLRKATKLITKTGELNNDPTKGLVVENLSFFESLGVSWEKFSVRDERLEKYNEAAQGDEEQRKKAIADLIDNEINPRIRHRLLLLDQILEKDFTSETTRPHKVVLEFARDEFMGKKSDKKKALEQFQNQRRDERLEALSELGANASPNAILKWQLCREQKGMCLFCGNCFSDACVINTARPQVSLENAEIAHIVADSIGGPRAYMNLVLACQGCNQVQKSLFHADAFEQRKFGRSWDSFVNDVRSCSQMRPFKKKLLTTKSLADAQDMVQKRTALQETAWIAKLARTLICLKYGWPLDFEGQKKRIVVVTGAVTNRVAKRYKLYRLLGGEGRVEQLEKKVEQCLAELQSLRDAVAPLSDVRKAREAVTKAQKEVEDKCREDKRHHALDAMVLSFLPHWAGDPGKNIFFGLPKLVAKSEFFGDYLDRVAPEELRFERPVLRETIYGLRQGKTGEFQGAIRREVLEMPFESKSMEGELIKFSTKELRNAISTVRDDAIRSALSTIALELDQLDGAAAQQRHWLAFCADFRLRENGPLIKKVSCWSDMLAKENYENLAKDQTPESEARGRGQWRCRKGSHQGQWLYLDKKGKPRIKAVKVFESKSLIGASLAASPDCQEVVSFIQSGCVIEINNPVISGKQRMENGRYRLSAIRESSGQCDLEAPDGTQYKCIPITSLLKAGFRRIV
jgi:CRISPR-associated endonuclease Csn1